MGRLETENQHLRRQIEADTHRMTLLEKRLAEAENSLFRTRKDAQGVLEAVTSYDDKRKELDKEAQGPPPPQGLIEVSSRLSMMPRIQSARSAACFSLTKPDRRK